VNSFADVVDRICDVITSETGIRATHYTDQPFLPSVMVYPGESVGSPYYKAMRGGVVDFPVVCHIITSSIDVDGQTRWLLEVASPWTSNSVVAAIHANPTLGTAPDENTGHASASMSAFVDRVEDYGFASLLDGTRVAQWKVYVTVKLTRGDL
jgi:hypothetical protein